LAPASSGRIDGVPFAWIADADAPGPVLEVMVMDATWVPFSQLSRRVQAPVDLRDRLDARCLSFIVAGDRRRGATLSGTEAARMAGC
jgi:type VI secretion system protein ImpE